MLQVGVDALEGGDRGAGGAAGLHAGFGVLHDQAAGRVDAEPAGGQQVALGIGLAGPDVVHADQQRRR